MDELNARLKALFRRFEATLEVDSAEAQLLREQFLERPLVWCDQRMVVLV